MRRITIKYITLIAVLFLVFSCKKESRENPMLKTPNTNIKIADSSVILPPSWAFGVLYGGYTNQEQTIATVKEIQQHDYPIDAYWIDSWFWSFDDKGKGPQKYIDFVADTIAYPNRKAMWDFLEQNHIKGGFWTWDCILETGNETAYKEFDSLGYFSSKFLNTNPWHNNSTTTAMFESEGKQKGTMCGNIDFNNPEAVAFFKSKMKHFFDEGADFLKLDRTSDVTVVKAMFEISQELGKESKGRGFMFSHTGGTDTDEFKHYPTKWTDDTRSDWTIESPTKDFNVWVPKAALKENIAMFTDPEKESSKIPFLTNDTGGFDMGITDKVDEELYIRWVQFSTFNPIMEVFSQPENVTKNLAFNYSERADSIFKTYSHLRMELFPYIYSNAIATRVEGRNIIRPVTDYLYEFYFGNEILVAPVYEQGATERNVFLPRGKWINFWTNETVEGNTEIMANAPIEQIPIYVKEGAIIPMRAYTSAIETGSNNLIILDIFPGENGKFTLYEDDGMSNEYLENYISETEIELINSGDDSFKLMIAPIIGSYEGMPNVRNWQLRIHSNDTYDKLVENGKEFDLTRDGAVLKSEIFSEKTSENVVIEIK